MSDRDRSDHSGPDFHGDPFDADPFNADDTDADDTDADDTDADDTDDTDDTDGDETEKPAYTGDHQDPDQGYRGFARADFYNQFAREGYDPDGYDAPSAPGEAEAAADDPVTAALGWSGASPTPEIDDRIDFDPTGEIASATADLDDQADALLLPDHAPLTLEVVETQLNRRRGEAEVIPTLDRILALTDILGAPQHAVPVIAVVGTNGKTSTSRMIDALLSRIGMRTGRFTSPHVQSVTERISIDNHPISDELYVSTYADIAPYIDMVDAASKAKGGQPLSKFEILTAMAYAAFADTPVDIEIIEAGVGGAWDSTNITDAKVAAITPIGLDHQAILGDTVAEIATNKAAIIKAGSVAVIGRQPTEAMESLLRRAVEVDATVARFGSEFAVLDRSFAVGGQRLTLQGLGGVYEDVFLPLSGEHQAENAALALAAVEAFFGAGVGRQLDLDAVQDGFAAVSSPGRLERVRTSPAIFIDAAHNPDGAKALAATLAAEFSFQRLIGVLAVLRDKDVRGILRELADSFDEVVVTRNSSPRSMSVGELAELAVEVFGEERVHTASRMDMAITLAVDLAESGDDGEAPVSGTAVLATGSVVTAGDVRALSGLAPA